MPGLRKDWTFRTTLSDIPEISFFRKGGPDREPGDLVAGLFDGALDLLLSKQQSFDPLGKEGVMRLLSDILFPVESTREFFTEDLNGSFEIISNYDYIQINASGDADKFLTILETLSTAVTNPQINKETTEKVRTALLAELNTRPRTTYLAAVRNVNTELGE